MTTIESNKIATDKSAIQIFDFLADANNHQQLMPENIYNWSSTVDECKFTIQNMAKLSLKISERNSPKEIIIIPNGEVPFDVNIKWLIEETNTGCTVQMIINADLNPFIKMMAMGPLNKLVNYQVEKLISI